MEAIGSDLTMKLGSLPMKPAVSNVQRELAARLLLSEALDLVQKLIRAYPNGGAAATGGYAGALAGILCQYPREIAVKCADPLKGVSRETKFLPTVADLVGWCERESDPLHQEAARDSRIAEQLATRYEQNGKNQALMAKCMAWLDRSDPLAAELSGAKSKIALAAEAKKALEDEYGIDLVDAVPNA